MSAEDVRQLVDRSMEARAKYPDLARRLDSLRRRVGECRASGDVEGEGLAKVEIGQLYFEVGDGDILEALSRGPCV